MRQHPRPAYASRQQDPRHSARNSHHQQSIFSRYDSSRTSICFGSTTAPPLVPAPTSAPRKPTAAEPVSAAQSAHPRAALKKDTIAKKTVTTTTPARKTRTAPSAAPAAKHTAKTLPDSLRRQCLVDTPRLERRRRRDVYGEQRVSSILSSSISALGQVSNY
jgi:hypothetical protein